jgi:hypothetical protein
MNLKEDTGQYVCISFFRYMYFQFKKWISSYTILLVVVVTLFCYLLLVMVSIYILILYLQCRDLTRILRPLVTFAEQIFLGLIMNKQEYNELNLIISSVG